MVGVIIFAESRRGTDHVKAALEHVPTDCTVTGTWRDTDYLESQKHLMNTVILCADPSGTSQVIVVYDGISTVISSRLDAEGRDEQGDTFIVNADGSLAISDRAGPYKTLPPD